MSLGGVYPLPESSQFTTTLVLLAASIALPVYLLAFRPVDGRETWGIAEMSAIAIIFLLTLPLLAVMLGIELPLSLPELTLVTVVQNALFAGLSLYVATIRYRRPPESLGLRTERWQHLALMGLVVGAATLPLSSIAENVANYLTRFLAGPAQAAARAAGEHMDDPLAPLLGQVTGTVPLAWILFLLAVVVPIGEEIFFRGLVYGGIRKRYGVIIAVLVSAAFFAAVHMQIVHALPIFVLAVVLAVLYERTGSLVSSILTHALNNIIAVLSVWRGWGF